MEKTDLSKFLIKDSEYYNPRATYVGFLKKKNLTTVDQLLNINLDSSLLKGFSTKTIQQLRGFISILEYKYLNKPLYFDVLLDECIDINAHHMGVIEFVKPNGNYNHICLDEFFGCPRERVIPFFKQFQWMLMNPLIYKEKYNLPENNVKLIDFLKWILLMDNDKSKHIIPFARTYVEAYEKQRQLENDNAETIAALKEQLTKLVETRKKLDIQISDLQQQIKTLSKFENKGGIKK